MPSHHLEVQFENCKTKIMFATEKLTDALGWKKVRTQATKHLSEAFWFFTSELVHTNIHKLKDDKDHLAHEMTWKSKATDTCIESCSIRMSFLSKDCEKFCSQDSKQ